MKKANSSDASSVQVRISWRIDGAAGHGSWHSERHIDELAADIKSHNRYYGAGSHWLETSKEIADGQTTTEEDRSPTEAAC